MERTRKRRDPTTWHRINRFLLSLILLAILAGAGLAFYPEWKQRNQLAARLEGEKKKLEAEQLLQKRREREVRLLQTDPGYVEIIARDKLGVMKEGETIFRLDGSRSPAVEAVAPAPQSKE